MIDAVYYRDPAPAGILSGRDFGAQVRAEAVTALAAAGPDEAALAVIDALTDSSDLVRSAAVRVLHGWREPLPLADAVKWLPANRGRARNLALVAVAELAQPSTARHLADALVHTLDNEPLRMNEARLVVDLLKVDTDPDAVEGVVEVLLGALGDEREGVAQRAEQLLAELAPGSMHGLQAALRGESAVPRAALVLARIGDLSVLEPLVQALEHANPAVRSHSCAALGELRAPGAVEPLLRAASDPDPDVRARAGAALNRIGTAAVIVGVSALVRPANTRARGSTRSRKSSKRKPSPQPPSTRADKRPSPDDAGALHRLTTLSDDLQHARSGRA